MVAAISEEVEKGGGTMPAEVAGRCGFLATVGRNTTGAVAARLATNPGANGWAVLFRTELEDSSGSGVWEGGAGAVRMVTGAVASFGATTGDDITMLAVLTAEYDPFPLAMP